MAAAYVELYDAAPLYLDDSMDGKLRKYLGREISKFSSMVTLNQQALKYEDTGSFQREQLGFEGGDADDLIIGRDTDPLIGFYSNGEPWHKVETLDGNGGNDIIRGRDGTDLLIGGLGSDSLYGGEQTDVLRASGIRYKETNIAVQSSQNSGYASFRQTIEQQPLVLAA